MEQCCWPGQMQNTGGASLRLGIPCKCWIWVELFLDLKFHLKSLEPRNLWSGPDLFSLEDLGRYLAFSFQSHHIYSANWILRFPASSFLFSPEFDWSSCIWSPLLMPHEKVFSPSKCHKCQPQWVMAPWYSPLQGSGISKKGSRYICSGVCKWKWVQSL